MKFENISRNVFLGTTAFIVFLIGGVFGSKEWNPYQFFEDGYHEIVKFLSDGGHKRPGLLEEIRYPGNGVTQYKKPFAYGGLTAIQGIFPEGNEIRLLNLQGDVIHRWKADFFSVWPDPVHIIPATQIPAGNFNYHTQGMWLLRDGSVVFNFAEKGTVKLDKCGNVLWQVNRMTHHSITPVENGSFWIPAKGDALSLPEDLKLPKATNMVLAESSGWYEDRLMLIGPDGSVHRELSVLGGLFNGEFERILYDLNRISPTDPTHINDIEVVTPELASKINNVSAGDLLLSMRQPHMIAIIDQHSGELKWHATGPWIRQHDLDITPEGAIEIFNNGTESLAKNRIPGSSIMRFDPTTGMTTALYPTRDEDRFYTLIMGTHQKLPNGNRLITETMAGRVFEIDSGGDIVWEFVKPFDDTHASLIESAIRYDEDYFSVQDWSCQ